MLYSCFGNKIEEKAVNACGKGFENVCLRSIKIQCSVGTSFSH